jgi:hypothetical protein
MLMSGTEIVIVIVIVMAIVMAMVMVVMAMKLFSKIGNTMRNQFFNRKERCVVSFRLTTTGTVLLFPISPGCVD